MGLRHRQHPADTREQRRGFGELLRGGKPTPRQGGDAGPHQSWGVGHGPDHRGSGRQAGLEETRRDPGDHTDQNLFDGGAVGVACGIGDLHGGRLHISRLDGQNHEGDVFDRLGDRGDPHRESPREVVGPLRHLLGEYEIPDLVPGPKQPTEQSLPDVAAADDRDS